MKPILFNTEMICAILDGLKTVTRRPIKPHYRPDEAGFQIITDANTGAYVRIEYYDEWENETRIMTNPYQCGDILYVRETWQFLPCIDCPEQFSGCNKQPLEYEDRDMVAEGCNIYRADCLDPSRVCWRPSIHMPREAARIFLRVADVRVERLHEFGIEDAKKEGVVPISRPGGCRCQWAYDGCMEEPCPNRAAYEIDRHVDPFVEVWDSTIRPTDRDLYGWLANPWVWVIEFERISREEAE